MNSTPYRIYKGQQTAVTRIPAYVVNIRAPFFKAGITNAWDFPDKRGVSLNKELLKMAMKNQLVVEFTQAEESIKNSRQEWIVNRHVLNKCIVMGAIYTHEAKGEELQVIPLELMARLY